MSSVVDWARNLTVETADARNLSEQCLRELHVFSDSLMREAYQPFLTHVLSQDTVYIFRKKADGSLVGFSYWAHKDVESRGSSIKVIQQGSYFFHHFAMINCF